MRSRTAHGVALLAVALVAASPVAAPDSAVAVEDTCRGQAATIVGSPGRDLEGTPAADVVLTGGATEVDLGEGDDLACVTGAEGDDHVTVDAGPGDDVVDATAATSPTATTLGTGSDHFHGGPDQDYVTGGDNDPFDLRHVALEDAEADLIETGAGADAVWSGQTGAPNGDLVDLGLGRDWAFWHGTGRTGDGHVGGADGDDTLSLVQGQGAWVVDNTVGAATVDGALLATWTGVETLLPGSTSRSQSTLTFLGSEASEELAVGGAFRVLIDMGGGDDDLSVDRVADGSSYDGGEGRDRLDEVLLRDVRFDMDAGSLVQGGTRTAPRHHVVRGFDQVRLATFGELRVRGTEGADHLDLSACRTRVDAGGGGDTVRIRLGTRCGARSERLVRGGRGADVLIGSRQDDVLVGGPGQDRAYGGRGVDLCRVERRSGCER